MSTTSSIDSYYNTLFSTSSTTSTADSAEKENYLGQEAFLELLMAEIQYQDPLDPMESTEMTGQIAQFSMLEQMQMMNTNLETIISQINTQLQLSDAASDTSGGFSVTDLIGKEVVSESDAIGIYDGKTYSGGYTLEEAADVTITIYDSNGSEVRTITSSDMDSGIHSIEWDGKDNDGSVVEDGEYTFDISAKDEEGNSVSVEYKDKGIVEGVSYENGIYYLNIEDRLVDASTVVQVNQAESSSNAEE